MDPNRPRPGADPGLNRRTFLHAGASAVALGGATGREAAAGPAPAPQESPRPETPAQPAVEWRNRQPGMAYRRLGRTNLMISEVVSGGDPITLDNYRHLARALEMGLNYLDMAPAYHDGKTEQAYGKLLDGSSAKREQVFLASKVSAYLGRRDAMYRAIFDGLPADRQEAYTKRAEHMKRDRGVLKPGYFLTYFPGQAGAFDGSYLAAALRPDFAHRVEGSPELRRVLFESVEGTLKRLGTDYLDILMCPHGANAPEDLDDPEILAAFRALKDQGKVRFLGVTAHNDPAGILRAATGAGHYDVVMCAYNVINGGYLEEPIRQAAARDVGLIAMKVAMAVATHHTALQPVPDWRIAKVQRVVPGDLKPPMKAYLWALQNPHIAAVISNLWDETYVAENLSLAGQKVELQPA